MTPEQELQIRARSESAEMGVLIDCIVLVVNKLAMRAGDAAIWKARFEEATAPKKRVKKPE